MKRILTFTIVGLLFGGLSLQAEPVPAQRALEIGKRILAAQPATKAGTGQVRIVWDGETEVATKSALPPAFYVVARDGGGFVIIAGDDNATPVLGISDRNTFKVEGMPDNVKWWMERMKVYVRSAKQTPEVQTKWKAYITTKASDRLPDADVTPVVSHFTPEWDQGNLDEYHFGEGKHVFNIKCPKIGGDNTLTGCVAVALGEVLTYQSGQTGVSMPGAAQGTIPAYSIDDGCVGPVFPYILGTTYDWAGLRSLTTISAIKAVVDDTEQPAESAALLDNLAQLLADLGAIMQASYSMGGTSAAIDLAPAKFIEHFGFNKGAYVDRASSYTNHQWVEKLKAEITLRPIVYRGSDPYRGGHAFVFDGFGKYGLDDVFHVNFGWGGDANGYYYNVAMDTDGNGNYVQNCAALFDFYPNPGSVYPVKLAAYYSRDDYPGVFAQCYSGNQYLLGYNIANFGATSYSGQVKFVVEKPNGDVVDIEGSTKVISSLDPYRITGQQFGYLPINDISFGDQVAIYYSEGENQWTRLDGPHDGTVITAYPLMPVAFIKTDATYHQGDWFSFELMNYDNIYAGSLWTIVDPDGTKYESMLQQEKEFQLTKKGTYKIKVAVRPDDSSDPVETIVTYITVQ